MIPTKKWSRCINLILILTCIKMTEKIDTCIALFYIFVYSYFWIDGNFNYEWEDNALKQNYSLSCPLLNEFRLQGNKSTLKRELIKSTSLYS